VAVAEPRAIDGTAVEAGPLTFVEVPELVAVLAEFPAFRVLTPADLAGPFDERTWPRVPPSRPEVPGSDRGKLLLVSSSVLLVVAALGGDDVDRVLPDPAQELFQ
jgi:hypothetical protein